MADWLKSSAACGSFVLLFCGARNQGETNTPTLALRTAKVGAREHRRNRREPYAAGREREKEKEGEGRSVTRLAMQAAHLVVDGQLRCGDQALQRLGAARNETRKRS